MARDIASKGSTFVEMTIDDMLAYIETRQRMVWIHDHPCRVNQAGS